MTKIDRKKIVYAILSELNEGNKNFDYVDFNVSQEIYLDIIKAIINSNLAQDFKLEGIPGRELVITDDVYITICGIEFLEKNSRWGKAYAGLKEFKSWIPGLGD